MKKNHYEIFIPEMYSVLYAFYINYFLLIIHLFISAQINIYDNVSSLLWSLINIVFIYRDKGKNE